MIKAKEVIVKKLSNQSKNKLQNFVDDLRAIGLGLNLSKLGKIYKTDKVGKHFYTLHYRSHFRKFKLRSINLLEIGAGGWDDPFDGAHSLRMWKKYFPFGKIFSIDICDKSALQEKRIKIFQGSQVDKEFLAKVCNEIGELDIIIDDGSHINAHVIETFKLLFPKLKDGGIYVIEDTQTSYWKDFGGDSDDLDNPNTMMNFFKSLTDSMNNKEFIKPGYVQTYFDKKIASMHFYHNLIFIYKDNIQEESNEVVNNSDRIASGE
ncbi:MAG: class I SAM-dependent methyltransferase [Bacteroidales bacterium]|nr:class I SAM-dependent methyltransferase [Bacteroidales bacterium]MCF8455120.1 class I SAM-dependent methyltransferase [Bacteroidales bacterium]